ncbi:MAG: hypothetical protein PHR06_02645, partial [Candidatus Cloacimonetes bacterium]|nr:hypothetical protein [Candidatus Cloacimonadota bacterium]
NDGQILFSGAAHQMSALSLINWEYYGLLHTGILGEILGTYKKWGRQNVIKQSAYSTKVISKITDIDSLIKKYNDEEMFILKNRGFNGIINGDLMTKEFSFSVSPFLIPDFLSFCLSLDYNASQMQKLYSTWILTKIPTANTIPTDKYKIKISDPTLIRIIKYRVNKYLNKFKKNIGMNPFDYWFQTNTGLASFFDRNFQELINIIENKDLKEDIRNLYSNGCFIEKTMAITLLNGTNYLLHD